MSVSKAQNQTRTNTNMLRTNNYFYNVLRHSETPSQHYFLRVMKKPPSSPFLPTPNRLRISNQTKQTAHSPTQPTYTQKSTTKVTVVSRTNGLTLPPRQPKARAQRRSNTPTQKKNKKKQKNARDFCLTGSMSATKRDHAWRQPSISGRTQWKVR